jgi:hypothetical protein
MAQEAELHTVAGVFLGIIPFKGGCIGPKHLAMVTAAK